MLVTRSDEGQWVGLQGPDLCFSNDETTERGIAFSHYSYVDESIVNFKSHFYGYVEAEESENLMVNRWRELDEVEGPVRATEYLTWIRGGTSHEQRFEDTVIDHVSRTTIAPNVEVVELNVNDEKIDSCQGGTVVVDLVAFQLETRGGIVRVWENILPIIVAAGTAAGQCFVLLERGGDGR